MVGVLPSIRSNNRSAKINSKQKLSNKNKNKNSFQPNPFFVIILKEEATRAQWTMGMGICLQDETISFFFFPTTQEIFLFSLFCEAVLYLIFHLGSNQIRLPSFLFMPSSLNAIWFESNFS